MASLTRRQVLAASAAAALWPRFLAAEDSPTSPVFFGDKTLDDAWRRRLQADDAKPLVDLLIKAATERLTDPLPGNDIAEFLAQPVKVIDTTDPSIQRYVQSMLPKCAMFYYLPMFALAFQLSGGDERFKRRTLEWLDVYTSWTPQPPGNGDIAEAYAAMGTVLAAQWLGDDVLGEKRLNALREAWRHEGAALTRWESVVHSNNHYWFTNTGLGVLAAAHPECFNKPDVLLDRLVKTFRESVPLAFSEAGEYNDGVIYALFTLTACGLFDAALRDKHKRRLFDDASLARLKAFPEFCLDVTCPDGANLPGEHEVIPQFNWMMARPLLNLLGTWFGDETLLARLRGTVADTEARQRGMKLWFWFRKDLPHPGDNPRSNVYWHGVFDLMWLPPAGPVKPLDVGARYKRYPYTGFCIARSGLLDDETMLYFRAGCASQKDMSDHNGFVWYPFGRRVIDTPRSNMDAWRDDTVSYFNDWRGFFGGSRAANVILVDGNTQKTTHPQGWPGQGDVEWLNRGKTPTTSRIVEETRFENGIRWTGEAQSAYPGQLQFWRRSVEIRDWVALTVTDEIKTIKSDAKIEWLLHSLGQWEGTGRKFNVTYKGVRVDVEFAAPADVTIAIEKTPVGQDGKRTTFLKATTTAINGGTEFNALLQAERVP